MGCIKEVHPMNLSVLLPGRIVGQVKITSISKSYTNMLQTIVENADPTVV